MDSKEAFLSVCVCLSNRLNLSKIFARQFLFVCFLSLEHEMYLIISSLSHINECFFAKITHGVLLRAGTKYTVSVFGVFDGGESMPLAGEEKTTLSDGPEPPPYEATGNAFSQDRKSTRLNSSHL